jgi:hypothetical protein
MVSTIKFSQFAATTLTATNNKNVGLSSGMNAQSPTTVTWTTVTRPSPPYNGLLGYNTSLSEYEFWDSVSATWIQLGTGGGGGGTITQINTGAGLTGGPITSTGTISFAAIAANSFWANTTGGIAVPAVTSLSAFLLSTNNLSDLTNTATARTNLGLAIGVDVQAFSAALTSLASVVGVANAIPYFTGATTYSVIGPQANSVLITSAGSVPSMSQTLPTAVQANITQLGAQSQALNMNSHLINNVTDPVNPQDAATRAYVLAQTSGTFLPLAGGTMLGVINMGGFNITNMADPASAQDAATRAYADTKLALSGGTMTGILNMGSHKIINVTDPSSPQDAVTLNYLNTAVGAFLPLTGGTMLGAINMGNFKIDNMNDPTLSKDAVNLQYLNGQLALYLQLSGGTMTGPINMGSSKITNLLDPTNPQDAATKNYVDLVATGLTIQLACYAATTISLNAAYLNGAAGIGATLTNAGALAAFATDGFSPPANARILVWQQSSTLQNGIYTLTNQGSGAIAWVLTRATDYDQPGEIQPGDLVVINNGTLYGGTSFIETASVSVIGTDPILFSQFTFSATAVLLKANNLSDVANTTIAFNNISPLTTKGDLIGFSTQNVRLPVGSTNGMVLQVNSAAATGLAWSSATYPATTTLNQILFSSATNTVTGISAIAGGVLVSDNTSLPQFLTNPAAAGKVLQSANAAIPAWSVPTYPSVSGTLGKFLISDGTNIVYSTSTIPTSAGAVAGKALVSDGTNYVLSAATFPTTVGAVGTILRSDGTNWVATTSTYPNTNAVNTLLFASSANVMSALATANSGVLVTSSSGVPSILAAGTTGQVLQASTAGTPAWSTPTYPTASGTSGLFLISNGTNNVYSTSTIPTSAGATANKVLLSNGTNYVLSTPTFPNASATSGKIIVSDGTNWIASTPTFPNASATARKIIVSDGTNWLASTETYAVPGTSGNVLTSDGTNWISSPSTGTGTVNSGLINQLAYYAAAGTTLSGLSIVNSAGLTTTAGGVPTWVAATGTGSPVFATSPTIAAPTLTGNTIYTGLRVANNNDGLLDNTGQAALAIANSGGTGINYFTLVTAITGVAPIFAATGGDANVLLDLRGKGTSGVAIQGTTAAGNATAGYVGEFVSSSVLSASAISISTNTAKNLTTISLTAGDWDVWGNVSFLAASTTVMTFGIAWVSSTSATLPDSSLRSIWGGNITGPNNIGVLALQQRFSLSGTTTIYISGYSSFATSTMTMCGNIFARRVR